jgi:hypothetical protein
MVTVDGCEPPSAGDRRHLLEALSGLLSPTFRGACLRGNIAVTF